MPAPSPFRKRELCLVRQADKVRTVLVSFSALFLLAAPEETLPRTSLAWFGLGLAAFFTLVNRFFVDWEQLQARGQEAPAAAFTLVGDIAWLLPFLAGTGGFTSPFNSLLLTVILLAGVFFGSLPLALPLTTAVVVAWFGAVAVAHGLDMQTTYVLAAQVISAVAVGWLGYALTGVLERERQTNESIVSHLTEGVALLEAGGQIALVNPRLAEMVGLEEADILGCSVHVLPKGKAGDNLRAVLADVLDFSSRETSEGRLVEISGEPPRDLRVSTVPFPPGARQPLGWVVVVEDVTDLLHAARMKEEGIAIVSHELRSPLATLRAVAQVLATLGSELDEEQTAQALMALNAETARLSGLVSKLLDASNLERGALALACEPVDPRDLVAQVEQLLRRRTEGRDLGIASVVEPGLPPVWADATRLEMALANLAENAVKFTPDGGRVTLGAARRGQEVVLSVSDTGPGIAPQDQKAIFDKFSRGAQHRFARGRQEGLGLGLYMARRIVEMHGGQIRLTSAEGQGSTFEIVLPPAVTEARAA